MQPAQQLDTYEHNDLDVGAPLFAHDLIVLAVILPKETLLTLSL